MRLTEPQKRIMRMMSRRWNAVAWPGGGVKINGFPYGRRASLMALEKEGLVRLSEKLRGVEFWKATEKGLAWRETI